MIKKVAVILICMLFLLTFTGCGPIPADDSKAETAYRDAITALMSAIDEQDHEAIYMLFAPSAREQDQDLEAQIAKMLSVYTGPTDAIGWDGLWGSNGFRDHGKRRTSAFATFPIRSGNQYYWCYLELMYENTYDNREIGIVQMDFYTAEEYCFLKYHGLKRAEAVGLTVHADATTDTEIRCIGGQPLMYSPSAEPLDVDDVRNFFKTYASLYEFQKQFGHPNAEDIYCYYEISAENGQPRYLQLRTENDTIYSAAIENEFEYLETIYDKED